jgi:hypothetical protein
VTSSTGKQLLNIDIEGDAVHEKQTGTYRVPAVHELDGDEAYSKPEDDDSNPVRSHFIEIELNGNTGNDGEELLGNIKLRVDGEKLHYGVPKEKKH